MWCGLEWCLGFGFRMLGEGAIYWVGVSRDNSIVCCRSLIICGSGVVEFYIRVLVRFFFLVRGILGKVSNFRIFVFLLVKWG